MPLNIGADLDSDTFRAEALAAIDVAAGEARQRFVSLGALVVEEYRQAGEAAADWRRAGYPTDDVPPEVVSGADYDAITPRQSADKIEYTAAAYEAALRVVRHQRLAGKKAVIDATTIDAIAAARHAAVGVLAAIVAPG